MIIPIPECAIIPIEGKYLFSIESRYLSWTDVPINSLFCWGYRLDPNEKSQRSDGLDIKLSDSKGLGIIRGRNILDVRSVRIWEANINLLDSIDIYPIVDSPSARYILEKYHININV